MTTARPRRPPKPPQTADVVSPGRRAAAVAIDYVYGGLASVLAALLASTWLLVRTDWGRDDVTAGDATFAAALLLAATPAWLAWTAVRLVQRGATPGQSRCRLRVVARPRRRLLRLACHPISVPGWLWLSIVAALASFESLALALATAAVGAALAGLVTAARVVLLPRARGLHDLVAGTRLVAA